MKLPCGETLTDGGWAISGRDIDFDLCIYVLKEYPDKLLVQRATWLFMSHGMNDVSPYGLPYFIKLKDVWCDCKCG